MSYILDAIKKSEQQRQRSKGPSFDAPMMATYAEKSNSFLVYGLIAATLLALGLLIGLFHPWKQEKASQIVATDSIKAEQAPQPTVIPPQPKEMPSPTNKVVPEPLKEFLPMPPKVEPSIKSTKLRTRELPKTIEVPTKPKVTIPTKIKVEAKETPVSSPTLPASQVVEKVAPSEIAPTVDNDSNESATQNKLYEIHELPPSILQEIPDMSIAGYALSENPKEHSVAINGRLLQEGDYLKQGLRLERISQDGLIFSYKNYHFRQSLQ